MITTMVRVRLASYLLAFLFLFDWPSPCFAVQSDDEATPPSQNRLRDLQREVEQLQKRLQSLEPALPERMQDPPFRFVPAAPAKVAPISEVIQNGKQIPFRTIVHQPEYQRPAYVKEWHSSIGRWSYMPTRIHYALHRLFTVYDIGLSNWYDFEHQTGLSIPMFQSEHDLDLYIVAFQTEIKSVCTKGNQIVVVGRPKRKGVQVITIKTRDVQPVNTSENLLVQLATRNGDEIDYSLISYVPPDFWAKQKGTRKQGGGKGPE